MDSNRFQTDIFEFVADSLCICICVTKMSPWENSVHVVKSGDKLPEQKKLDYVIKHFATYQLSMRVFFYENNKIVLLIVVMVE